MKFGGDEDRLKDEADKRLGAIYTNYSAYSGTFKPWDEDLNAAQFIGTFSADVIYDKVSNNLIFIITDSKSYESLSYRIGSSFDRETNKQNMVILTKNIFGQSH